MAENDSSILVSDQTRLVESKLDRQSMVNSLMSYSPYGVLGQVFILEAIRYYSEMISATEPKNGENENALINPTVWHGIALNVKERLSANFDGV